MRPFSRPCGTNCNRKPQPGSELPGYCQISLRENSQVHVWDGCAWFIKMSKLQRRLQVCVTSEAPALAPNDGCLEMRPWTGVWRVALFMIAMPVLIIVAILEGVFEKGRLSARV